MPERQLYFLGSPLVTLDGRPVEMPRRKALALLAYLACVGESHRRERLAALFWPETEPARAYAYLRQSLWEIHRALGNNYIQADRETIGLAAPAQTWSDVRHFRQQLAYQAAHLHPAGETCPACIQTLQAAVECYRGDFLEGFGLRDSPAFDEWQFFQAEALRREFSSALQKLIQLLQAAGQASAAIPYARRWLSLDPLDENAHRQLMQLYALNGERGAALRQYQECARILEQELGLQPDAQTRQLHQRIQLDTLRPASAGEPANQPAAALDLDQVFPSAAVLNNLPAQPTPFVGRRLELDELARRLSDPACRLVTLLGPGGIGKTRLAIQAAAENSPVFAHGVVFVSLAALTSPQSIIPAIADALGIAYRQTELSAPSTALPVPSNYAQLKGQLYDHLSGKHLLLVLDNFEHLIAGAGLLPEIAARAAGLKLMVTSRQRLNLSGEWVLEVGGMRFPSDSWSLAELALAGSPAAQIDGLLADYSAMQLFLQSARRARADFTITAETYPAVARLAQLVEGMPLGLELAAPWVSVLSCDEIAAEIERNLDILETSLQDIPERQHSIRAVFDHSWSLLSRRERQIFPQLAIFRNGFTRQAVQHVAGVSLPELASLVNKSLLRRTDEGRFEIHELLRQYAAEKLDVQPDLYAGLAARHAACYCQAMQAWGEALKGAQQRQALAELQVDLENVLQAWHWAAAHQHIQLLEQVAEGLGVYCWRQRRLDEGRALFRSAALEIAAHSADPGSPAASPQGQRMLAYLLISQGYFTSYVGESQEAEALYQQALHILDSLHLDLQQDWKERALYLYANGVLQVYTHGDVHGAQLVEQSLAIYRQFGDRWNASQVLSTLGWIAKWQRSFESSNQFWEEAKQLKLQLGDQLGMAIAYLEQAVQLTFGQGDLRQAERLFIASNQILAELGDQASFARILENMDHVYIANGRFLEALDVRQRKLAYYKVLGHRYSLGLAHAHLCEAYQMLGDYRQSISEGRAALEILSGIDEDFEHGFASWMLGLAYLAAGDLQQAGALFQASLAIQRRTRRPDGIGCLLIACGRLAFARGETRQAWEQVLEGLRLLLRYKNFFWALYGIATLALLLAERGEIERSVTLYALAEKQPFVSNSRWFADVFGQHIEAAAASLSQERRASAQAGGQQLELWETVAGLLQEFSLKKAEE